MLLSYYFYTYYARFLIDQLIVKANFITSLLHYFTDFTGEVSRVQTVHCAFCVVGVVTIVI